jgi:hypothetical protein
MRRTVVSVTRGYPWKDINQIGQSGITMNLSITKATLIALVLALPGAANADFGVGMKAGTLGLGIEGRWSPLPWLDIRGGFNRYDYEDSGEQAGIDYDGVLALDNYFLTGNFRFPLSPFRVTAGAYSNGNELQLVSQDTGGQNITIGGIEFSSDDVGSLYSTTSFEDIAPYVGVGYDFELFGKVGLNLDFGVLWQGEPMVSLDATGLETAPPFVQLILEPALEIERLALEDEISDYKAWPVVSLSFVYNF